MMKKVLLLISFMLFSSCIVFEPDNEKNSLSDTTWRGNSHSSYSVAFGFFADKATFTFTDPKYSFNPVVTASYMWEVDFGGVSASMYRLDPNGYYVRDYYAFYRVGRVLYGNLAGSSTSTFHFRTPEPVANLF